MVTIQRYLQSDILPSISPEIYSHKLSLTAKMVNNNEEVSALGQHIYMSAHKTRRVIDQIHGRSYEDNDTCTSCLIKYVILYLKLVSFLLPSTKITSHVHSLQFFFLNRDITILH